MDDPIDEIEAYVAAFPALVAVAPVAERIDATDGFAAYLESVAIYSTGFAVRFTEVGSGVMGHLMGNLTDANEAELHDRLVRSARPWAATDDQGVAYESHGRAMGGGDRLTVVTVWFEPAPGASAGALYLDRDGEQVAAIDLRTAVPLH